MPRSNEHLAQKSIKVPQCTKFARLCDEATLTLLLPSFFYQNTTSNVNSHCLRYVQRWTPRHCQRSYWTPNGSTFRLLVSRSVSMSLNPGSAQWEGSTETKILEDIFDAETILKTQKTQHKFQKKLWFGLLKTIYFNPKFYITKRPKNRSREKYMRRSHFNDCWN